MVPTDFTRTQKAFREGLQLIHDSIKHITTLSAGSIVLITTFLEKFSGDRVATRFLVVAIGLLLLSIFCSIFTMLEINGSMMKLATNSTNYRRLHLVTISCFALGILLIAISASINLWQ
jgi:uncharacterized membrane protein